MHWHLQRHLICKNLAQFEAEGVWLLIVFTFEKPALSCSSVIVLKKVRATAGFCGDWNFLKFLHMNTLKQWCYSSSAGYSFSRGTSHIYNTQSKRHMGNRNTHIQKHTTIGVPHSFCLSAMCHSANTQTLSPYIKALVFTYCTAIQ